MFLSFFHLSMIDFFSVGFFSLSIIDFFNFICFTNFDISIIFGFAHLLLIINFLNDFLIFIAKLFSIRAFYLAV